MKKTFNFEKHETITSTFYKLSNEIATISLTYEKLFNIIKKN